MCLASIQNRRILSSHYKMGQKIPEEEGSVKTLQLFKKKKDKK